MATCPSRSVDPAISYVVASAPGHAQGLDDCVFIDGDVYKSNFRFEKGEFIGKKAMLSITVGTGPETYAYDGRSGDIDLLLWRVNFSFAFVGFDVLEPHIAYGVGAGLRYSDPQAIETRLQKVQHHYVARLQTIEEEAGIPFDRMEHWGPDGRIKPAAPSV